VVASRGLGQTMRAVKEAVGVPSQQAGTPEDGRVDPAIDYLHAFYLATLGGASALGIDDKVGTFGRGMEFDAIILSAAVGNNICIFDTDGTADIFQKICTQGDDRNILKVFVKGQEVVTNETG